VFAHSRVRSLACSFSRVFARSRVRALACSRVQLCSAAIILFIAFETTAMGAAQGDDDETAGLALVDSICQLFAGGAWFALNWWWAQLMIADNRTRGTQFSKGGDDGASSAKTGGELDRWQRFRRTTTTALIDDSRRISRDLGSSKSSAMF
jgi:hypothetical protein